MKRALFVLLFLAFAPESETTWGGDWSPLQYVSSFLAWNPLKLPMLDVFILLILIAARDRAPTRRELGVTKAVRVSAGAILVWIIWGVIHSGNTYQMQFQLHTLIQSYVFGFAVAKVLVTPEDFIGLGKVIFFAGLYRSFTCFSVYVARSLAHLPLPEECCTTHHDTVLYVSATVAGIVFLIERNRKRSKSVVFRVLVGIAILLTAIQINNRRLAWVSLVGSVLLLYLLLPKSPLRAKINKRLLLVAPIIGLYVAVGTGRPEKIFSPLRALSSVKSQDDPSTRSRDNENLGLIITGAMNPLMGTGWGHEYIEVDSSLSAGNVGFLQYRYLPHNSVLALLAFTGILGFASTWMVFPVCIFYLVRTYRRVEHQLVRMAAIVGAAEVLAVINQWYGDLGMQSPTGMLIFGTALAAAIRLPAMDVSQKATVR